MRDTRVTKLLVGQRGKGRCELIASAEYKRKFLCTHVGSKKFLAGKVAISHF